MLFDIIIKLRMFFNQNLNCNHNYILIIKKDYIGGDFYECKKCDKIKNNV